ncbi:LTA synthase family protein [Pseudomonas japonica]|uniref:LTA synthase family protein n=1 Tax=Pseudomonas japonica TaxID=256466 RepID=UPI0015E47C96|nr:LTA synthase family protein [Pseudomonas japonica]MBA1241952.1 LTA synthase family protein [Pseudomonas japonica]
MQAKKTIIYFIITGAACLAIVSIAQTLASSLETMILFIKHSSKEFLFSSILVFLTCIVLDCVIGRKYISIPMLFPFIILISAISGQKSSYRSEPLYPWDFLFVRQIFDLLPLLMKERPLAGAAIMLVTATLTLLTAIAIIAIYKRQKTTVRPRIIFGSLAFIPLAFTIYGISPAGSITLYRLSGIMNMAWEQSLNYSKNGFLLAFAYSLNSAIIEKPNLAIENAMQGLPETAPKAASLLNRPNIVIIMSESFWDATKLPLAEFVKDPIPTLRANQTGEIFSPTYGGGTANVEFEALTGLSNAFLPTGSLPYQQYIKRPIPSVVRTLSNLGYRSVALHPYHKWFWNREKVYSLLGFDEFLSIDQLNKNNTKGLFYSDKALSQDILKVLRDADKPTFLFVVTMQNHGPYEKSRYLKNHITIKPKADTDAITVSALETYSEGTRDADIGFRELIKELSRETKPTLVIFFGDHLPMLGLDFETYRTLGLISSKTPELSTSERIKLHSTPLIIWSNYDKEKKYLGIISPNFIPHIIDEAVEANTPFYGGFLDNALSYFKIIDKNIISSADLHADERSARQEKNILEQYKSIQYDILFGDQRSAHKFSPYSGKELQ